MPMQGISKLRESKDDKELVSEISREDVKNVELLKEYYNKASEEEKKNLANEFDSLVKPELSTLDNSFEIKESAEVDEKALNDLKKVEKFNEALDKYPNISQKERNAIDHMIYSPINNSEDEIERKLQENNKTPDKNIES